MELQVSHSVCTKVQTESVFEEKLRKQYACKQRSVVPASATQAVKAIMQVLKLMQKLGFDDIDEYMEYLETGKLKKSEIEM